MLTYYYRLTLFLKMGKNGYFLYFNHIFNSNNIYRNVMLIVKDVKDLFDHCTMAKCRFVYETTYMKLFSEEEEEEEYLTGSLPTVALPIIP